MGTTDGADAHAGQRGNAANILGTVVEQRYEGALQTVSRLRAEHPEADADELSNQVIRRCARDLALGGAMTGGAAASPVAGMTAAAATLGAESMYGVSRLGEMVMAIGILHGLDHDDAQERAVWVAAALGATEGAALGLTGMAARAGSRGGARLIARLPTAAAAAAGSSRSRRLAAKMASKGGPWGLAALVPYGIGAGVGAMGNAAMAWSVGRAAKTYFVSTGSPGRSPDGSTGPHAPDADIVDAEFIEETILGEE